MAEVRITSRPSADGSGRTSDTSSKKASNQQEGCFCCTYTTFVFIPLPQCQLLLLLRYHCAPVGRRVDFQGF